MLVNDKYVLVIIITNTYLCVGKGNGCVGNFWKVKVFTNTYLCVGKGFDDVAIYDDMAGKVECHVAGPYDDMASPYDDVSSQPLTGQR